MCTSKSQVLTPITQRTSLSLPQCPPPPKAQKPNLTHRSGGFPSLPFVVNNGEIAKTGVDMMLKSRPAYQASASFSIKTFKKEQVAMPDAENIALLLRKARGSNRGFVIEYLPNPHIPISKAAWAQGSLAHKNSKCWIDLHCWLGVNLKYGIARLVLFDRL